MNPITRIDGYKLDHRRQAPNGSESILANWTARGSRIPDQKEVVFFGLQAFLYQFNDDMAKNFFAKPVEEVVEKYVTRVNNYLGPNTIGSDHIKALHNLQYIPLVFEALPEGTLVPLRVPMFTVENTVADFFWLVNYFETWISCSIWGPCTSATLAYRSRKLFNEYAKMTGGSLDFVAWQGHDFSMRGMYGHHAAAMSGAGHLLSFLGTDTIPAIEFLEEYYGATGLIGGSVAATEHSVMCAGGKDDEIGTLNHILDLYTSGIVSIVSDTWDLWKVCTVYLPQLKERIMARDGKVVIRPDSGDPVKIICGDPDAPKDSPAYKGLIELLWDCFGGTINKAGYKELDSHIGGIYGDAITFERSGAIMDGLRKKGFASTNIVLGIGSFTYQYVTRDTFSFAMKTTWTKVNGEGRDLWKKPVTDTGEKFSATGRLAVVREGGTLKVIERATPEQEATSLLQTVWRDGWFFKKHTLADVRKTLWG